MTPRHPVGAELDGALLALLADAGGIGVDEDTPVDVLGLSSIGVQAIMARLEDEWGLRVPVLLLFEADTAGDFVAAVRGAIDEGQASAARPPITRLTRRT